MITPQQIEEKWASLPEELKEIISGIDFATIIPGLGEKYGLNIEKQGILHTKINMLILGVITPDEFEGAMKSELKLSQEQAEKILLDADELILAPIRQEYMGVGEEEEEIAKETPSQSPPYQGEKEETPSLIREGVGGGFKETQTKLGIKTMADILKEEQAKNPLSSTGLPKTVTDYSMPKITDPYKEKID